MSGSRAVELLTPCAIIGASSGCLARNARRSKVIPHAFGERAVSKLMYAALVRATERWRDIRMTEFEQRQLSAIRNELDRAHAERTASVVTANVTASQPVYPANNGLDQCS